MMGVLLFGKLVAGGPARIGITSAADVGRLIVRTAAGPARGERPARALARHASRALLRHVVGGRRAQMLDVLGQVLLHLRRQRLRIRMAIGHMNLPVRRGLRQLGVDRLGRTGILVR